jgi:hypothetical protein
MRRTSVTERLLHQARTCSSRALRRSSSQQRGEEEEKANAPKVILLCRRKKSTAVSAEVAPEGTKRLSTVAGVLEKRFDLWEGWRKRVRRRRLRRCRKLELRNGEPSGNGGTCAGSDERLLLVEESVAGRNGDAEGAGIVDAARRAAVRTKRGQGGSVRPIETGNCPQTTTVLGNVRSEKVENAPQFVLISLPDAPPVLRPTRRSRLRARIATSSARLLGLLVEASDQRRLDGVRSTKVHEVVTAVTASAETTSLRKREVSEVKGEAGKERTLRVGKAARQAFPKEAALLVEHGQQREEVESAENALERLDVLFLRSLDVRGVKSLTSDG